MENLGTKIYQTIAAALIVAALLWAADRLVTIGEFMARIDERLTGVEHRLGALENRVGAVERILMQRTAEDIEETAADTTAVN